MRTHFTIVTASLLAAITFAALPASAHAAPSIAGCWTQTSPFPFAETPPGKEWGSRTWCFKRRGVLTSVHLACPRGGGCDGWDNEMRYRWRHPFLSVSDVELSDDGKHQTKVWRRCRVSFPGRDRMVLVDCYFSADPWVRGQ